MHPPPPISLNFRNANSKGNALFLILIAVFLFAALSYAVTHTSQGGKNATSTENTLMAQQILDYVTMVNSAINEMMVVNGVSISLLSFEWPSGTNANQFCITYPSQCGGVDPTQGMVFFPSGGNVLFQSPPAAGQGTIIPTFNDGFFPFYRYWFRNVRWETGGGANMGCSGWSSVNGDNSCNELVIELPYLNQGVCLAINNILGITNPGGDAPLIASAYVYVTWNGTNADGSSPNVDSANPLPAIACTKMENQHGPMPPGTYVFYDVYYIR